LARPARRARTGISLLEVLVSIFVLSIGLLAVAAIIPVARFQMIEAAKADRSTACATAALNDLKVRGVLNPDEWRDVDGDSLGATEPQWRPPGSAYDVSSGDRGYLFGESYALDPIYISEMRKTSPTPSRSRYSSFPYNPNDLDNWAPVPGGPQFRRWTRLQRVTWNGVGFSTLLANSMFQWHDDLLFPVPADDTQRPEQLFVRPGSSTGVKPEFQGNYSYLVTVVPSPENIDFGPPEIAAPYSFPENSPLYRVSVAVFYKRDKSAPAEYLAPNGSDPQRTGLMEGETPGERQVRLTFLGSGLGGGDVRLTAYSGAGEGQGPEYLALKENEWMLVSGSYPAQRIWTNPYGELRSYTMPVGVHQWYRIVAAGDIRTPSGSAPYRDVTLAGPDWNLARWNNDYNADGIPEYGYDSDGDGTLDTGFYVATLLKGVVGVYSTTVELTP
jgi:hypothetical protein